MADIIDQKDYEGARNCADRMVSIAGNIRDIFDDIDNTMDELFGGDWDSSGAENARERYDECRKSYEPFYEDLLERKSHIYDVTHRTEEADINASNAING